MVDTGVYCSGAHVLRKAGFKVNPQISGAEAFTNDFIGQAEAFVNASTRYNWSGAYGTLSSDAKNILKEVTSCVAATYMIDYDMKGYTSRSEAQTMLNYLWARADKCINLLNDDQVRKYLGVR